MKKDNIKSRCKKRHILEANVNQRNVVNDGTYKLSQSTIFSSKELNILKKRNYSKFRKKGKNSVSKVSNPLFEKSIIQSIDFGGGNTTFVNENSTKSTITSAIDYKLNNTSMPSLNNFIKPVIKEKKLSIQCEDSNNVNTSYSDIDFEESWFKFRKTMKSKGMQF